MGEERVSLTFEEAVAMLPDAAEIHTFLSGGMAMIGAAWDREDILDLLRTGRPELSGDLATSMNHGLVAWRGSQPVFIETRSEVRQ